MKTRKNRMTKTLITVGSADEMGLYPEDDCSWFTLCEDHGNLVAHPTRRLADAHAAQPYWCEDCQTIINQL